MFAIAGSFATYGLLSELVAWQILTFFSFGRSAADAGMAANAASAKTKTTIVQGRARLASEWDGGVPTSANVQESSVNRHPSNEAMRTS